MKNLRLGLLGCGPIAQFAHLPALEKARGVELVALCDASSNLLHRIGARYGITELYTSYSHFLESDIEAVLIAVADPFHVPLATQAIEAGKHVLVEKPLGVTAEECRHLSGTVSGSVCKLQVGSMKRHDPGIEFAKKFIEEKIGEIVSVKGWYQDTSFRPALQETLLPLVQSAEGIVRPEADPKADREKYFMATHGSHLFDNIRYLGGEVEALNTRFVQKSDQYCWQGLLEFSHGGIGEFDLTVKVHSDWSEGYEIQGEGGAVLIKTFLPFYYRPSEVRAFERSTEQWHTPLGAHSNPYKRQLESFAKAIREDLPTNPDVFDGLRVLEIIEAAEASVRSGERVEIARGPTEVG